MHDVFWDSQKPVASWSRSWCECQMMSLKPETDQHQMLLKLSLHHIIVVLCKWPQSYSRLVSVSRRSILPLVRGGEFILVSHPPRGQ